MIFLLIIYLQFPRIFFLQFLFFFVYCLLYFSFSFLKNLFELLTYSSKLPPGRIMQIECHVHSIDVQFPKVIIYYLILIRRFLQSIILNCHSFFVLPHFWSMFLFYTRKHQKTKVFWFQEYWTTFTGVFRTLLNI